MDRRRYLAAVGAAATSAVAGCGGLFETRSIRSPPLVENRPDAVYVPSHVEGMQMIGMATADRLRIALSYSYAHRFWLVNGDRTNRVEVADDDSAHLMVSVWDAETGVAIPSSNASLTVTRDGETVVEKSMWQMLSQNMGVHYGDNVALDGDGTYEVEVRFGPVGTRRTGDLAGAFGDQVTRTYTFQYSEEAKNEISFETLDERAGEEDAMAPMQMEMMPVPQLPEPDQLPGRALGQGESGDGVFVARVLEDRPDGIEGSGPYLAVSARTPYNRYPLPFMSLSAELARGGETVYDGPLTATLDPAIDFHYGAAVDGVESGDALSITPETPPQVARHEGYETAFLDMDPIELTV